MVVGGAYDDKAYYLLSQYPHSKHVPTAAVLTVLVNYF